MHDSSNSYLIIAVSDLVLSQTEFGKKVGSTLKMKAGDWRWIAGEEPHRLRNEGNGAARWITIEPQ
jgi:hypothetical protein